MYKGWKIAACDYKSTNEKVQPKLAQGWYTAWNHPAGTIRRSHVDPMLVEIFNYITVFLDMFKVVAVGLTLENNSCQILWQSDNNCVIEQLAKNKQRKSDRFKVTFTWKWIWDINDDFK